MENQKTVIISDVSGNYFCKVPKNQTNLEIVKEKFGEPKGENWGLEIFEGEGAVSIEEISCLSDLRNFIQAYGVPERI